MSRGEQRDSERWVLDCVIFVWLLQHITISLVTLNNTNVLSYNTNVLSTQMWTSGVRNGFHWADTEVLDELYSLRRPWGECVSLPFPASRIHFLVHGSFLHLQSWQYSIFKSLSVSIVTWPSPLTLSLLYPSSKDCCDYTGLTQITQDNLPISRTFT